MNEAIQVFVHVVKKLDDRWTLVKVKLQDGTESELAVENYDLEYIDKSAPKAAWLSATYSGEQNGLAMVELPAPILDKGSRLTLKTEQIRRRSLEDLVQKIKPQITNKGISPR